jgi:hypothetical protein
VGKSGEHGAVQSKAYNPKVSKVGFYELCVFKLLCNYVVQKNLVESWGAELKKIKPHRNMK